uniref:Transmembrane domain-containing protein n=1 Tax=Strongyloides stercoralis TaxID=6248 RepID=A0A0K0E2V9_STRER
MLVVFFIFITSVNLISQVKSTCTTYKSFKLLGKVQNSNKTILPCLNNVDSCTYISLNIPGYVIGYFSGCPENADLMLESILAGRSDLLDYFMPIIDNKTRLINHNLLCERTLNGNQPYFLKTMSGIGQFYVHCYNQNELYLNQGVKFIPPLTNSTPVLCVNGEKTDICNEGYCAMAEISSINVDGKSQYSEQYQYCPNILINLLYVKSQRPNIMFNNALLSHLFDIGPICVDKSSYQVTSKNGTSSYFWYVNCYVPNSTYAPQFPNIPNLTIYAITTTSKPFYTTTKIAISLNNFSIFSLIIVIIVSIIFKY